MPERGVVAFQGRREGRSAFALVNAQWSRALSSAGYRVVDFDRDAAPPDFVIHHDFESHFTAFEPPSAGKCIAVRTWDFGPLPPVWAGKINSQFHQYWAYSSWIAEQARAAGVEPERIRVVPLGIDPAVFTPEGPARPLATDRKFRFLFVGGVSLRKGTDLLLDAYAQAFSRKDDVCLVLKDHSGDLFYRENHARERIARLLSDPDAPAILHVDDFLPEAELAALYRSCDVAVFPYRAEGFCLPILEAMASGTPSIAPDFGACLDFCSPGTSYLVKARRIRAPVSRGFSVALGFTEVLSEVDFCELPVERLAEALRAAREAPRDEHRARSRAGVAWARDHMTWAHSGAAARACLEELH
ncbi:MAG TPA: glycosyltransferase family 4 protein [Gemmatimonadales bacterium]|nr:glycosyltransferase family 4 protein [Gemmatimonadales bacterium]